MNYDVIIASGALGMVGGIVRATIGLFKSIAVKRKIYWPYWIVTGVISSLIGLLTGIVFSFDPRLSILAGYAGTDILEGIYKSFKVEKFYVKGK